MSTEHTVKAFDEDITRLRGLIAEMGGLAELAIRESLQALVKGDEDLARDVVKRDKKIDALEMEVDKLAVRIIALRAPMADDLREVIAALKIAGVVERIGDYSKNIAKRVGQIDSRAKFDPLTLLPAMGEIATPSPITNWGSRVKKRLGTGVSSNEGSFPVGDSSMRPPTSVSASSAGCLSPSHLCRLPGIRARRQKSSSTIARVVASSNTSSSRS